MSQRLVGCGALQSRVPATSAPVKAVTRAGFDPIPTRRGVKEGYICPEQSLLFPPFPSAAAFAWGRPLRSCCDGGFLGGQQSIMTPCTRRPAGFDAARRPGPNTYSTSAPRRRRRLLYCGSERPLARTPNGGYPRPPNLTTRAIHPTHTPTGSVALLGPERAQRACLSTRPRAPRRKAAARKRKRSRERGSGTVAHRYVFDGFID